MDNGLDRLRDKKNLAILVALGAVVAYLYADVIVGLADDWWNDPDYSHGMLVPFISLYFIWDKRKWLSRLSFAPDLRGLVILLGSVALLTLGNAGSELFLMRVSLVLTIAGLIVSCVGLKTLKVLLFPIGFLFFMIPLPAIVFNAVAFPLQLFAAQTAAFCLKTVQIPVLREGNLIYLATSIMDVTEACSGIRSLMTLATLGTLFAYITQKTNVKRAIMILSTIPIAIFSNALRVTGTGLLAQYVGEEAAQGFYHTFTGWLVFISAFAMMLVVGWLMSRVKDRNPVATSPPEASEIQVKGRPLWMPLSGIVAVFAIGIYFNTVVLLHGGPTELTKPLSEIPLQIEQWRGEDQPFEAKTVKTLGVTEYVNRLYIGKEDGSEKISSLWFYAGYYASQRGGSTYHSPKNCLPGSGWEIVEIKGVPVSMTIRGQEQLQTINKVIVQKGLDRQLILYWYQDRGRVITSEYWAKIYLIWDSITMGRTDGAMIRVSVPIPRGDPTDEAMARGLKYIERMAPILGEHLPGASLV